MCLLNFDTHQYAELPLLAKKLYFFLTQNNPIHAGENGLLLKNME